MTAAAPARRRAARPPRSTSCSAVRSACARWRCCGCSPARSCSCTCVRSSPTRWHGRIYRDAFYEPYAVLVSGAAPRGLRRACSGSAAVAAVAMTLGLLTRVATATTFAIVAYNLFLSTTHFHNNRAYLVIVLGLLAVAPCGRELSVDAWLRAPPRAPALDRRAPAWPLWLLRFECAAIYGASGTEQAARPRLVRRHGHLAAGRAGQRRARRPLPRLGGVGPHRPRLPHGRGQADRRSPSCSSRSGCGRAARATRRCGSRSSSTSTIQASASVEVFSLLGDRRARHLGRAVDPRPRAPDRPERRASGAGRGGAPARLAGPLPRRAGAAGLAAGGRGP